MSDITPDLVDTIFLINLDIFELRLSAHCILFTKNPWQNKTWQGSLRGVTVKVRSYYAATALRWRTARLLCGLLHRNCDVSAFGCRVKVKFILT